MSDVVDGARVVVGRDVSTGPELVEGDEVCGIVGSVALVVDAVAVGVESDSEEVIVPVPVGISVVVIFNELEVVVGG